ncbi:MAG: energy transducer TonB [Flavobacteriaceae bacterium]|jgi:outer membrane biosynthesis protein TonB|nr:energy transducer TonB [Flavobacteriaceae bacterium]
MKFLETEYEKKSFAISSTIMVVLLFLCLFLGLTYLDPPPDNGILINFGNTDAGSGNTNTMETVKTEARENTNFEESTSVPTTSSNVAENVLTSDNEESIALKKQKELADAKAKAEEKQRQEEARKKSELDKLIGGIKQSDGTVKEGDGNTNKTGNQGILEGSIYANAYYGQPGTGNSGKKMGMNGRNLVRPGAINVDCNDEGTIVVEVTVNQSGTVINSKYSPSGSNTTSSCLRNAAIAAAKRYKWNEDNKAPNQQIGFIVFNFKNGVLE